MRVRARPRARASRETIDRSRTRTTARNLNTSGHPPLSCSAGGPVPGPVAPGYGYPVLSHPATVPSQIPLRRVVSHSERFLDVSQYETLGTHLEAVYGPYSTSAPCTMHSTIEARQDTNESVAERALSPVSSGPRGLRS